jgi:hypothetical protein
MNSCQTPVNSVLEVAAQVLHSLTTAHHAIDAPDRPQISWNDLDEPTRRSYRILAQKAAEASSFEDFYAFTTLAESLAGLAYPDAEEDTERTRGARAQYYLVQHLTCIESGPLSSEVRTGE